MAVRTTDLRRSGLLRTGLLVAGLVFAIADAGSAFAQSVASPPRSASPEPSISAATNDGTQAPTQPFTGDATAETPKASTAPEQETTSQPAANGTGNVVPADADQAAEHPATDTASTASGAELPHDLSPRSMFMHADVVVKTVMIGLALASLVTWIIWLAKTLELAAARMRLSRAIRSIVAARDLAEADKEFSRRGGVAALLVRAAGQEVARSEEALDHAGSTGLLQRIASHLSRIEAGAGRRMSRGTGILATIGSTSPFIGLFGTVWGIMNAFIGISQTQTTNLAVVAPGIAEALLATATGLVAAIPAVVIYNIFTRSIGGYKHLLADASAGVERLVSRDLDFRQVPSDAERLARNERPVSARHLRFAAE